MCIRDRVRFIFCASQAVVLRLHWYRIDLFRLRNRAFDISQISSTQEKDTETVYGNITCNVYSNLEFRCKNKRRPKTVVKEQLLIQMCLSCLTAASFCISGVIVWIGSGASEVDCV